jgi:hypothetical protein
MKKGVVVVGLFLFLSGSLMGQGLFWRPGFPAGSGRHTLFGPIFSPHVGFPGTTFAVFPVFQVPRDVAAGLFVHQFIFGHRQPVQAGAPFLFAHPAGSPYYWGHYGSFPPQPAYGYPTVHDMAFVQEWKNRPPPQVAGTGLSQSILLSEGMNEEEIVGAIGTPLQRIKLGEREVWRYSGYSLLLENGALQDIR